MVSLILRFRVPDFDTWRPLYEQSYERETVIRSHKIWRGLDDPHLVFLLETYDSREAAEALLSSPAIQAEIAEHGIDLASSQLDWLELMDEASR